MKTTSSIRLLALTLAAAAALSVPAAHADTLAFSTGNLTNNSAIASNTSFGYTFTLANTVSVTQLGFYVYNAAGLSQAIPVTIYNGAGTSVASATVPAGRGTQVNSYSYITLATPVSLAAGTYTIGAYTAANTDRVSLFNNVNTATGITYGGTALTNSGNGNTPPTSSLNGTYFGPNFQFNTVPEPSTWAALAAGAGLLGVVTLRRRAVRGA